MDLFDFFPIAAKIDDKIFCVHAGLSPSLQNIADIREIDRFKEIPHEGPFADLMWSDPDSEVEGFKISERGAGYIFGEIVVNQFLHMNNIDTIVRAHQLCFEGYNTLFNGKIITVWSAPHYMNRYFNMASIMEIDENLNKSFNIFEDAERKATKSELKQKTAEMFNNELEKYFQQE